MANVYDKERTLEQEISGKVAEALPGVEVLAVELTGPERFTVYIDRAEGVDHALCERVTHVLSDYLRPIRSPSPRRGSNARCASRSISSASSAGR